MTADIRDLIARHPVERRARERLDASREPRVPVVPRMCACSSPEHCSGTDGRSPAGNHCKRHLVDTLEIS